MGRTWFLGVEIIIKRYLAEIITLGRTWFLGVELIIKRYLAEIIPWVERGSYE